MSNNTQCIVRRVNMVVATYSGTPSEETRKKLKEKKAVFKNGQWIRHLSDGEMCSEAESLKHF